MAKDPAMLWYWNDWNSGTVTLSRHLKGCYIDLLHAQFNNGHLSLDEIKTVLGADFSAWNTLQKKFEIDSKGLFFNKRLEEEQTKRKAYTESRRNSRLKCEEDNVRIYIVRDNIRSTYKIGSSVNPIRRYNELSNQKNPAIMGDKQGDRNISLIWYSEIVERKAESELHDHFLDKNITGEWFNLSDYDLKFIYTKYKGTFHRTIERTENENINRIENENFDEKFKKAFDEITCERYSMTFKGLDLGKELQQFRTKCDNDPASYHHRDSAGLRTAFQYQLKNIKINGKRTSGVNESKLNDLIKAKYGNKGTD